VPLAGARARQPPSDPIVWLGLFSIDGPFTMAVRCVEFDGPRWELRWTPRRWGWPIAKTPNLDAADLVLIWKGVSWMHPSSMRCTGRGRVLLRVRWPAAGPFAALFWAGAAGARVPVAAAAGPGTGRCASLRMHPVRCPPTIGHRASSAKTTEEVHDNGFTRTKTCSTRRRHSCAHINHQACHTSEHAQAHDKEATMPKQGTAPPKGAITHTRKQQRERSRR